ncbi:MAG: hypothetical protein IPH18_08765 [Chitinophagaceae bacterium]|nr:hypothetical protein [Chitinophagaceae bacterium]
MRIRLSFFLLLFVFATFFLSSCSDEKEEFVTEKLEDYLPLAPGKYITYRLDSLTFSSFGTVNDTTKYQVKHVIDSKITDNLGRTSYRVYRFIRDSVNAASWTPSQPWINAGSYFITPLTDQVEVIEDNLRFIKLHLPIKSGFTWKGNHYLPVNAYNSLFFFTNDDNMSDWDYYYEGDPVSFSYKGNNYNNVLTVEQADEAINVPIVATGSYAAKTRSVERYSRNIGLVFRHYELWDYQVTGSSGSKNGFGITMWMIDHN